MPKELLFKNSFYNLLGLGLPLLVAIFSIPQLIYILGESSFGLLSLIWAIVSYFGLFDLGVSRALTLQLSRYVSSNDYKKYESTICAAIYLLGLVSVLMSLVLAALSDFFSELLAKGDLQNDFRYSLYLMAFAIPAIILTSGLRAALEASQKFGLINKIRVPMGVYTFIAPLACAYFGYDSLTAISLALVAGRYFFLVIHLLAAVHSLNLKKIDFKKYDAEMAFDLLRQGGWITVTNVINPIVGYLDRFMISAILTSSAVAYYATPNEIVTKLWIIPAAITTAFFPMVSANVEDKKNISRLASSSTQLLFSAIFPVVLTLFIFSSQIMTVWIGEIFSQKSYELLQIFSIGILINSLAQVPFTVIQGSGSAKITATIHACILPVYAALLFFLTKYFGLIGAGFAWLIRVLFDSILMIYYSNKIIGSDSSWSIKHYLLFSLFIFSFAGLLIESVSIKILWIMIFSIISGSIFLNEIKQRKAPDYA